MGLSASCERFCCMEDELLSAAAIPVISDRSIEEVNFEKHARGSEQWVHVPGAGRLNVAALQADAKLTQVDAHGSSEPIPSEQDRFQDPLPTHRGPPNATTKPSESVDPPPAEPTSRRSSKRFNTVGARSALLEEVDLNQVSTHGRSVSYTIGERVPTPSPAYCPSETKEFSESTDPAQTGREEALQAPFGRCAAVVEASAHGRSVSCSIGEGVQQFLSPALCPAGQKQSSKVSVSLAEPKRQVSIDSSVIADDKDLRPGRVGFKATVGAEACFSVTSDSTSATMRDEDLQEYTSWLGDDEERYDEVEDHEINLPPGQIDHDKHEFRVRRFMKAIMKNPEWLIRTVESRRLHARKRDGWARATSAPAQVTRLVN